MARRRKRNSQEGTALGCLILVIFFGALVTQVPGFLAFLVVVGLPIVGLWYWLGTGERRRMRALKLADVDSMSGHHFEHYVAALLEHQGFETTVTKGSGDLGVDVIATKGDLRYAVQTKRYTGAIPRTAVSDAVAGMHHYRCNAAMVVTNSRFSEGAKQLARSSGCVLVDRDTLAEWIASWQGASSKEPRPVSHSVSPPLPSAGKRIHSWDCACGTRNAPVFEKCHRCGGPMSRGRVP